MAQRLEFSHSHSYARNDWAVTLPVSLNAGGEGVDLLAAIDTGASHCIFEHSVGVRLGLRESDGEIKQFRTANAGFTAFGHEVEINALGIRTYSLVYFFADPAIRKNVLGRNGWLDRLRIGISDYDRTLYLATYTDDHGPHTTTSRP